MYIYHLVRDDSRSDYDVPRQYIIVASNPSKARKIAAAHDTGKFTSGDWLDTKFSTCKCLGTPSNETERIVLVEIHEG